ncbi:MAG TPA: sulfite exporter TauE/SafE family protein, partial [Sphingomicrobium sp.]|nr:sulfite exporter TauE/SafE family protein [Sphingomicrobium sp.]
AITNFFDTLGIGSFAPTMAWFKLRKLVPDRLIPCTMLVGHTLPTLTQAIIFLLLLGVLVDPFLLAGCVLAVLMGGLLGAPLVAKTRVWIIQLVVGCALIAAASLYAMTNLGLMPGGGTASSLPPLLTIIAIVANFIFGVLLNFGIGNYAPTLVMLSLMGMDPRLSFPIMAGGAAMAATGASARHISMGEIDLRLATGMALGGIPAVFVAAFIVKSMPLEILRWMVIVVVLYAALMMLRSAAGGRHHPPSLEVDRAAAI